MIILNNMLGKSLDEPTLAWLILSSAVLVGTSASRHPLIRPPRCPPIPNHWCWERGFWQGEVRAGVGAGACGSCARFAWGKRQKEMCFCYILQKRCLLRGRGVKSAPGEPWVALLCMFSLLFLEEHQRSHIWEVWSSGEGCWGQNLKKFIALPSQVNL